MHDETHILYIVQCKLFKLLLFPASIDDDDDYDMQVYRRCGLILVYKQVMGSNGLSVLLPATAAAMDCLDILQS